MCNRNAKALSLNILCGTSRLNREARSASGFANFLSLRCRLYARCGESQVQAMRTVTRHFLEFFAYAQVFLLAMIVVQIFVAMQPARHYWMYLDGLAATPFWGFNKTPWLYVELPTFRTGAEGERDVPPPRHNRSSVRRAQPRACVYNEFF